MDDEERRRIREDFRRKMEPFVRRNVEQIERDLLAEDFRGSDGLPLSRADVLNTWYERAPEWIQSKCPDGLPEEVRLRQEVLREVILEQKGQATN